MGWTLPARCGFGLEGRADAGGTEFVFLGAEMMAAGGELAGDDDGGDGVDAVGAGLGGGFGLLHIADGDFAGVAGETPDEGKGFVAQATTCAEDFDLFFRGGHGDRSPGAPGFRMPLRERIRSGKVRANCSRQRPR